MSPYSERSDDSARQLSKSANSLRFDGKESKWQGYKLALNATLKQDRVEEALLYDKPRLSRRARRLIPKKQTSNEAELSTGSEAEQDE